MNRTEKPLLSIEKQVEHLKSKGVRFTYMSEEQAIEYLKNNNNYFKLRAYRKNFPQHPDGENAGKYINLDFAELKDLAIIDMRMRYLFVHMALDIEHYAKVKLIHAVEDNNNDGYQIVEDYIQSLKDADSQNGTHRYEILSAELDRNKGNPYCGGIIEKYSGGYPVWAFVEIISLGSLIHFLRFCAMQFNDSLLQDYFYLLMTIKELRNAAAHSNCIIHEMGKKDSKAKPNYSMLRALSGISKAQRDSQLGNERMRQMITLLYTHSVLVSSAGVRRRTKQNLDELVVRMNEHQEYYTDNENIKAAFAFFQKAVDILYKV